MSTPMLFHPGAKFFLFAFDKHIFILAKKFLDSSSYFLEGYTIRLTHSLLLLIYIFYIQPPKKSVKRSFFG